jgi:hypothetical protein
MNAPVLMPGASLAPSPTIRPARWSGILTALRAGRPRLVLALALAATFAAWAWFGTAAILPLLYVLPCAAMMAMCMAGHGTKQHPTAAPMTNDPNTGASA